MNYLNQFSAIAKIGGIAIIILIAAVLFFPLAIILGVVGVPLIIYYAWLSEDHAFPNPFKKDTLN